MPDVISEPATPRPKVVFVAATVQVVFEVLNLPTVSVLTIAWASWCDNNYCSHRGLMSVAYNQSPNPYSARHVVFDWIAFAMGLILASGLLHSARPQGCIRCCCNGGCGPSRYPAAPNGWLKVAALLSVQVTVRLLGLLVNVLADCLNRSYWYSRSGLWDGTVECDPIWPYTIVRGVMLFPPLVTLGCTLCAFRAEHRAARRPMPGSADALPTEVAPAEHHTSHSALEIDEEADKAKAALPAPAHRRRRSICTPLGAFWLLVAVELVATALTAALQIELVLRPECECDDAVGAPVWLPPGCRMPSWAGEQEPALVATADGTSVCRSGARIPSGQIVRPSARICCSHVFGARIVTVRPVRLLRGRCARHRAGAVPRAAWLALLPHVQPPVWPRRRHRARPVVRGATGRHLLPDGDHGVRRSGGVHRAVGAAQARAGCRRRRR